MKRALVIGMLAIAGCNSTPTSPVIPDETIYLTSNFAFTYAELLGTTPDAVAELTTANFERFLGRR
jgi:hypothetical protein